MECKRNRWHRWSPSGCTTRHCRLRGRAQCWQSDIGNPAKQGVQLLIRSLTCHGTHCEQVHLDSNVSLRMDRGCGWAEWRQTVWKGSSRCSLPVPSSPHEQSGRTMWIIRHRIFVVNVRACSVEPAISYRERTQSCTASPVFAAQPNLDITLAHSASTTQHTKTRGRQTVSTTTDRTRSLPFGYCRACSFANCAGGCSAPRLAELAPTGLLLPARSPAWRHSCASNKAHTTCGNCTMHSRHYCSLDRFTNDLLFKNAIVAFIVCCATAALASSTQAARHECITLNISGNKSSLGNFSLFILAALAAQTANVL
jgi:hypothetical protein